MQSTFELFHKSASNRTNSSSRASSKKCDFASTHVGPPHPFHTCCFFQMIILVKQNLDFCRCFSLVLANVGRKQLMTAQRLRGTLRVESLLLKPCVPPRKNVFGTGAGAPCGTPTALGHTSVHQTARPRPRSTNIPTFPLSNLAVSSEPMSISPKWTVDKSGNVCTYPHAGVS